MKRTFCDICNCVIEERSYNITYMLHADIKNLTLAQRAYKKVNGRDELHSGRELTIDTCLTCYNKVMIPLLENINKLKDEHTI